MTGHGRAPRIGFSGHHEIRTDGVVGWWHREPSASVSREMLLAGLGSLVGGSFCVALGAFFLLFQHL